MRPIIFKIHANASDIGCGTANIGNGSGGINKDTTIITPAKAEITASKRTRIITPLVVKEWQRPAAVRALAL